MEITVEAKRLPAVIVGTGPSLNFREVYELREAGHVLFAVNNAYTIEPDWHVTVNPEWWDWYHPRHLAVRKLASEGRAWHSDPETARRYGLKDFQWKDDHEHIRANGLSKDRALVHLGHSSGFTALNIAYLMGFNPIVLIGHDMRYPKNYDAQKREPGGARHYFGEYPQPLQHWPRVRVGKDGELWGLIECYEAIPKVNRDVEIINLSPNSALHHFPRMTTEEYLNA